MRLPGTNTVRRDSVATQCEDLERKLRKALDAWHAEKRETDRLKRLCKQMEVEREAAIKAAKECGVSHAKIRETVKRITREISQAGQLR